MSEIPRDAKNSSKYNPAMQITDQAEADAYFEKCVRHCMSWGKTREEAEHIERENIGYWAGYYDAETRMRVQQLYKAKHPVFGDALTRMPDAFAVGVEQGQSMGASIEQQRESEMEKAKHQPTSCCECDGEIPKGLCLECEFCQAVSCSARCFHAHRENSHYYLSAVTMAAQPAKEKTKEDSQWIKDRVQKVARLPISVIENMEEAMLEAQQRERERVGDILCRVATRLTWLQERFCKRECPESGTHIDVCISTREILAQYQKEKVVEAKP